MRLLILTMVFGFSLCSSPASAANDLANDLIDEIYKDAPAGVTPPKSRDPQLLNDLQGRLEAMDDMIFGPLRKTKATKSYDINLHLRNLENPRSRFCDDVREMGHELEVEIKTRMKQELPWWHPVELHKMVVGVLWARSRKKNDLVIVPNAVCSRRG